MNKLISFFILLTLLTVGLTHNFTIVFAEQNPKEEIISNNKICNLEDITNTKNSNSCIKVCIYTTKSNFQNLSKSNNLNKKKLNNSLYGCNSVFNLTYFHKNIIKKTSPPYFYKNINNYSYHILIKIVKSNI